MNASFDYRRSMAAQREADLERAAAVQRMTMASPAASPVIRPRLAAAFRGLADRLDSAPPANAVDRVADG